MTRGRLIQRFVAVLQQLDAAATDAVVGGGYDDLLGEISPVDDGTQLGASSKVYQADLRIKCQLDRDPDWGRAVQGRGGAEKRVDLVLVLHRPDLEQAGLLDSNNQPMIYRGDRVARIENIHGALVEAFPDPSGMYVQDVERAGYGLSAFGTPRMNLYYVLCRPDQQGAPL